MVPLTGYGTDVRDSGSKVGGQNVNQEYQVKKENRNCYI